MIQSGRSFLKAVHRMAPAYKGIGNRLRAFTGESQGNNDLANTLAQADSFSTST